MSNLDARIAHVISVEKEICRKSGQILDEKWTGFLLGILFRLPLKMEGRVLEDRELLLCHTLVVHVDVVIGGTLFCKRHVFYPDLPEDVQASTIKDFVMGLWMDIGRSAVFQEKIA